MGGFRALERASAAILVAGVVAGLLMVATEFAPVAKVDVANGSCEVINDANPKLADRCTLSGFERHGGALLLLGALTVAMAFGAAVGGSRPAAFALLAIGAAVIVFALVVDLPETGRTGAIGRDFEGAHGVKGTGLWLELIAGALALAAGAAALMQREA
jgi:hypothetical protein